MPTSTILPPTSQKTMKWTASTTAIWTRMIESASPSTVELTGILTIQVLAFWLPSMLLILLDHSAPSFSARHKIQPTSRQATAKALRRYIPVVLRNQALGLGLKSFELVILDVLGHPPSSAYRFSATLPSFYELILHLTLCIVLCDILFYTTHLCLHHRLLYRRIHKQHHQCTAPFAIVAQHCHPVEHILSNLLPFWLPPRLLGCHFVTCFVFWTLGTMETVVAHCGYDLGMFGGLSTKHDAHHERGNVNFGTLGGLDWWFGTNG